METSARDLRRVETRFEGESGRSLFRRAWLPPDPTAALVIVHGFGEHSGRYEALARFFGERGFAVHALDLVGHGQSAGRRGHVDDFGWFLDDVERFIALVRAEHPERPVVLLGHSMGGLVVASLAGQRSPDVDLIVTSGAALAVGPGVSPFLMALARLLRRVWPTLSMEAGLDVDGLSTDPEVIRAYQADPLVHGRASVSFAASMDEAGRLAYEGAGRVSRPMLLLHGEADPLCQPDGSRRFFDALPRGEVAGSDLRIYPGLRHEIFNEPDQRRVFQDMFDWVVARLAEQHSRPAAGTELERTRTA